VEIKGADLQEAVLNTSFFDTTEEEKTFSFYRKIYKSALALISSRLCKSFLRN
jgi:hypothetical protein